MARAAFYLSLQMYFHLKLNFYVFHPNLGEQDVKSKDTIYGLDLGSDFSINFYPS